MTYAVNKQSLSFVLCLIIAGLIWIIPPPATLSNQAIHLLAIFVFTILGIITKFLPMGAVAIIGLTIITVTKTLKFDEAFSGFYNPTVWLIVAAFFIARGFIKTGLGERIAYHLMILLGKSTLGMGYGIVATDLVLAPAIPSVTARMGGVIYPVVNSLSRTFGSEPHSHPRKMGAFLIQAAFQGSLITSAMFLTAMAGNPLIMDLAREAGVNITWGGWALAASVPGLISLILIPFLLYKIYPPETKKTPHAHEHARKELKKKGPMTWQEWVMVGSFFLLLILWISGPFIKMQATVAALIGLSLLLLSTVLTWDDVLKEKGAWNTLIWFAVLVMMASFLNKLGLTTWFSQWVVGHVQGLSWQVGFGILTVVYFYSHYFFASNVAHIGSMYGPFLLLGIALGAPPVFAALSLAFFSSLFGGLTHYGCGPAPILFGSGYVKLSDWWRLGFMLSVVNVIIWIFIGGSWWSLIGL